MTNAMSPLPYCWVCEGKFTDAGGQLKRHEHHVIPRAYGGANGPLCSVCTNHHNLLHEYATYSIANNQASMVRLLSTIEPHLHRRLVYLASRIVRAYHLTKDDPNKCGKVTIVLTGEQARRAVLLKKQHSARSMQALFVKLLEDAWTNQNSSK